MYTYHGETSGVHHKRASKRRKFIIKRVGITYHNDWFRDFVKTVFLSLLMSNQNIVLPGNRPFVAIIPSRIRSIQGDPRNFYLRSKKEKEMCSFWFKRIQKERSCKMTLRQKGRKGWEIVGVCVWERERWGWEEEEAVSRRHHNSFSSRAGFTRVPIHNVDVTIRIYIKPTMAQSLNKNISLPRVGQNFVSSTFLIASLI